MHRLPCQLLTILFCVTSAHALSVWPPPRSMQTYGPPRPLHPTFQIRSTQESKLLETGLTRHNSLIALLPFRDMDPLASALRSLSIQVLEPNNERLNLETDYSYSLNIIANNSEAQIIARSVYGAFYGMETFAQLLETNGMLSISAATINDAPENAWRGLMIDSGRRFFPLPLVENLLDTMAAVKLNVLHFHVSDMCRFGVESKIFPQLTEALVGDHAGFYKQSDIKYLIAYAKQRGIRIVPEFDVPGHARGFLPLEGHGIQFCSTGSDRNQLFNDPQNSTMSVLKRLFAEMANLFEDDVFNIGCDETVAKGNCTTDSMFAMERELVKTIEQQFGKIAEGWEEILFVEHAATQSTIVNAWTAHNASSITATGRRVVESSASHFYFTDAAPGGPAGWSRCHYDIGKGVPESQRKLLLGGEMSMWSDRYTFSEQCGAYPGPPPVGHQLFSPSKDDAFAKSIGGMIWPRGFVASASFWNFNASLDPASEDFQNAIYKLNDRLASRGSLVCPSHCSCDELTACGKPYLNTTIFDTIVV